MPGQRDLSVITERSKTWGLTFVFSPYPVELRTILGIPLAPMGVVAHGSAQA